MTLERPFYLILRGARMAVIDAILALLLLPLVTVAWQKRGGIVLPSTAVSTANFDTPYSDQILAAANKHGVEPALFFALIESESNFDATAVSHAGAQGLGQLMPATAQTCGVQDSFDVEENLDCAAWLLAYQLDKFGDVSLALAAYNAGEGAVASCMCVPNNGETEIYVPRVLAARERYRSKPQTTVSSSSSSSSAMVWPYRNQPKISGGLHGLSGWEGVDIVGGCGAELVAPIDGIVTYNARDGYIGPYDYKREQNTMLTILGDSGEVTLLHGVYDGVAVGNSVKAGETILGYESSIGNSTGCHTHLIVKVDGYVVNPLNLIGGG